MRDFGAREERLLRLCCLTYSQSDPPRPAEARRLVDFEPELSRGSVYAMAALGDMVGLRQALFIQPRLIAEAGGPFGWTPLLYALYSRFQPADGSGSTAGLIELLLARGADPNAGFQLDGLPIPFTALTGAFGKGEDSIHQPQHPEALAVAEMLLKAGADPNDAQSLYNLQFEPDNSHLDLLFRYGLGDKSDGPWYRKLGSELPSPKQLLELQMLWAVERNYVDRVQLLSDHSVSSHSKYPGRPGFASRPANILALILGNTEIAARLNGAGSETPLLTPSEALLARCMLEDEYNPLSLPGRDTPVVKQAIAEFPDAVVRATSLRRPKAVERLVGLGFEVNYLDRITPLHQAAMDGELGLVKKLLWLGADPGIRDKEFQAEPAAWARYFQANDVAEFLEGPSSFAGRDRTFDVEVRRVESRPDTGSIIRESCT